MTSAQIYILIAIIILAIIAIVVFFTRKDKKQAKPSLLTGLAFLFIFAGIFFGQSRSIGYSLMGVGGILAIIDIILKLKKK